MAWTPANQVSKILKKNGILTSHDYNEVREAVKPINMAGTGISLTHAREMGDYTVQVRIDLERSASYIAEAREEIIRILSAAGYDCKVVREDSIWLREPNWFAMLSERGRKAAEERGEVPPVEWRADRLSDGWIIVHRTDCDVEPRKRHKIVRGRTREEIGLELNGSLIKKSFAPERNYKIVKLHTCITEE